MKIGIIISSLRAGGAERTAVALANWLAENTDNEIYLINLGKNDNCFTINSKVILYNKKSGKNIIEKIKNSADLLRYLRKIKLNIAFEMLFAPLKYLYVNKIVNPRMIIIGSERNNPKERYKTAKLKFLSKVSPILCNGYIFQTEQVKKMFSKKIQRKGTVIPNAISNPEVYNITLARKREKKIVSVGRLTYQKGYDNLIKAFKEVNKKYPEYTLEIYGEGEDRKKLDNLISELSLTGKVLLPGNSNNVIANVSKSDIFIMTSRFEGMPNALLEAMAIGMPCISTNCVAGPSEIIENNHNGILIEVDNCQQIAEKIIYLIENPNIKDDLGDNAKLVQTKYTTDIIYNNYYEYFKEVYYQVTYNNTLIKKIFYKLEKMRITNILPDSIYLKVVYRLRLRKKLDLKSPKTFNEKLNWLKLNDRKSIYCELADKYEVRKHIKRMIGEQYLIPLIGVYNNFEEIDFEKLPSQFVIKCTHDSGGLVICRNKENLDIAKTKEKINKSLKNNFYYHNREWPYKNIKPRIIVEKYMEDEETNSLRDYKFYCFNGEPKYLYVSEGLENHSTAKISFLDMDFNYAKFKRFDFKPFIEKPKKPKNFEQMKKLAKVLSKEMSFLRVDFYEINGNIYFGELTFTPCGGFMPFDPEKYDAILGDMISL